MRAGSDAGKGLFLLLLAFLGAFAVLDLLTPDDGVRLLPFSTLAPFIAGALLGLRPTAVISGLCLALITLEYGFVIADVSGQNRAVVVASAAAACLLSVVVCRARLAREARTESLRMTGEAVQRLLLRPLPRRSPEVEVHGFYIAAEREAQVGGDVYEVLATPFGTRLMIGDVRGKGLPAIGAGAAVLSAFRESAYLEPSLATVVQRMETGLSRWAGEEEPGEAPELFVTASLLEFGGGVRAVTCGHPPPLILRDRPCRISEVPVTDPGLPLGMGDMLGSAQRVQDVDLPPGSRLLLFTDGVSEARDAGGTFYPLADRLHRWTGLTAARLLAALREDLERHAGGSLNDDASALVVERRGGTGP